MKRDSFLIVAIVCGVCCAVAQNKHNGHIYVDLGLPSGLKWATCNVGATNPEECGDRLRWGETYQNTYCSWSTYKWCKGSETTLTKYCTNRSSEHRIIPKIYNFWNRFLVMML